MIKFAANTLLAAALAPYNEFANLSSALGGIGGAQVMADTHLSRYRTARTREGKSITAPPASFYHPDCGFGGSCLPKDANA